MRKKRRAEQATLTCATHGRQDKTFVCVHIVAALQCGEPVGFFWNRAGGVYQAICASCNDLTPEEFAAAEADIVRELCFGCFRDAAELNGAVIA
ncbi:MAG: hypothetical protein AAGC56_03465 [Pseudomonadota bacterium]